MSKTIEAAARKLAQNSKKVISGLQKENAELKTKLAEAQKLAKQANDSSGNADRCRETADYLVNAGVLHRSNAEKVAKDLQDPTKAHNLIRNYGYKLAAAERAPSVGSPGEENRNPTDKTAESADDMFSRRLREANGVA